VLIALVSVPQAFAEEPAVEAPPGYGVAHVVLRSAADAVLVAEALCQFAPRVVVVSGAVPLPALSCDATVIATDVATKSAAMVDEDAFFVLRPDASGEAAGLLQRERRAHRGARWFFLLAERYVPLVSPREELILQADDPVDALLAAESPIADPSAGAVRPFGGARVFAAGLPGESSFRTYWVDASGIKALGPASPISALPSLSPSSETPSE
jgi:hypothetical protein